MSMRLDQDLTNPTTIRMGTRTADGRTEVRLTPCLIDAEAQSLYGYHSCHYLASAISGMTGGWPLVTLMARPPGGQRDLHAHTGTITPDGRVLDIWGEYSSIEAFRARWEPQINGQVTTHAPITPGQAVELVTQPGETKRHGDLWWAHNPGMTPIHQHFARTVLRRHGLNHHLRPEARTGIDHIWVETRKNIVPEQSTPDATAAPKSTATTTFSGGSVMSTLAEQARHALSLANEKATYVQGALQQARLDLDDIIAQLSQVTDTAETVMQATAIYMQAKDNLEALQGLVSTAAAATDLHAGVL
ncbi:hypothetical protein [Saccharopolyspora sp. ASAGF58]|uniref:hypothetical protein n=1 Tax=Saccharopolyspora sp. ASAGF58 TaxID=2719023 RepID=UPI00143FE47C|nr:hypothetical protein [Saccharopolyspora sp. ASAGF58]QIZ33935.1 hypothetical protein FDZ84_03315 [Saccharopolyspora sp. ASAGF58]